MKTYITCADFGQLAEEAQTNLIWESGVFLARRDKGYYKILLFQLEGFYAEVWYHAHFNVLIKVESFSDTDLLEPYFDKIELAGLFNEA